MTFFATVLRVDAGGMLVRNQQTGEEIYVNFNNARNFRPGDVVRITSTGQMTPSIPPQITATSVVRIPQITTPPTSSSTAGTEIRRAQIMRVERDALLVRDPGNSRLVTVRYPYAHHFCMGQRVNIRYDTITFGNPIEVTATDIFPIC